MAAQGHRRGVHLASDAAATWSPTTASILLKTGDLAASGTLVFDGIVVRDEFKQKHPDLVLAYLKEYERHVHACTRSSRRKWSKVLSPYLDA